MKKTGLKAMPSPVRCSHSDTRPPASPQWTLRPMTESTNGVRARAPLGLPGASPSGAPNSAVPLLGLTPSALPQDGPHPTPPEAAPAPAALPPVPGAGPAPPDDGGRPGGGSRDLKAKAGAPLGPSPETTSGGGSGGGTRPLARRIPWFPWCSETLVEPEVGLPGALPGL